MIGVSCLFGVFVRCVYSVGRLCVLNMVMFGMSVVLVVLLSGRYSLGGCEVVLEFGFGLLVRFVLDFVVC